MFLFGYTNESLIFTRNYNIQHSYKRQKAGLQALK